MRAANGRPFAAIQQSDAVAQSQLAPIAHDMTTRSVSPATGYKLTETNTSSTVHANGPGVVVLTEVMWAGDFRARVNGRSAPVIRVNHAFKGVMVPSAGDYQIELRYWPKNFGWYLIFSGAGCGLLMASLVVGTRRPGPRVTLGDTGLGQEPVLPTA
jgi:hypothetical protein